ncbi:hypothetical protein RGP42_004666 [Providencia rettgeri]|nr:hypothetical protein [Providencia rettgeri]
MSASKTGSNYHLGIKVIFVNLFRAIFFPLFALWMLWKINMSSKNEILENLARYREASDKLSSSVLDISTKALEITGYVEHKLPRIEENKEFYEMLEKFFEIVTEGVMQTTEYSSSLRKDYRLAIEKIANSKDE